MAFTITRGGVPRQSIRKENILISYFAFLKQRVLIRSVRILQDFEERKMTTKKRMLLFAVLASLFLLVPRASAQPRAITSHEIHIVDAYYDDLDLDGYLDDIKILLEFSFTDAVPARVDLNIWIELPSGLTYSFRVSIYRTPNDSILNLDCIDMATESGWYTVTMLASIMGTGNGRVYITDQLEFDPPTEAGPGLPGVYAYF
jgi:hypothetical protein